MINHIILYQFSIIYLQYQLSKEVFLMRPLFNNPKIQNDFNLNSFFSQQIQNSSYQPTESFNSSNCFNIKCYDEIRNGVKLRAEIYNQINFLDEQRKKLFATVSIFSKKSQEQFRDQIRGEAPERKKRNRRNADQIQRNFTCPQCDKLYGTEGSLAQHIKLKHSSQFQLSKKDSKSY